MPRPAPAILPDIGPGPYRRPGDHPGPAEPDSRESGYPHDHHLESELRRPAPAGWPSLPPIVRAVDDQAPAYDREFVTRASMLAVARLHTIGIELVNEERHVHLVHLVNGFGGMRLVTSFVTFFLDHLVPPSVAHHVVPKPRLLPGRPFYFAADSGDGGPNAPLRVVLPAACIPAYRSPRGWLARSDGRTAREPGMEMLAAPTAVHVSGGPDGETRLGRMWEAGRLSAPGGPTPFEVDTRSPHLTPAMSEQLRSGAAAVIWKPVTLHLDELGSCARPPRRSTTYCVLIKHRETDAAPEHLTHLHVTFDVPLAELVQGVCDEVSGEAEGRGRLEPRAREAWERPVVVQR